MTQQWDQAEMSFVEHLRELRTRLIYAIGAVFVFAIGLFWPAPAIIRGLVHLYFPGIELHAFGPADVIGAEFKFALFGGIVLGLPVILYQVWMFAVPAVSPQARRHVYFYVFPTLVLAALGIAFCHFFIMPHVIGALLGMTAALAVPTFGIESTMSVILILFLAFALIFQTPVVMLALARIGLVNATQLRRFRRHTFMGTLVLGAIAAPDGSPLTMMLLALPMYVLFEIGLLIIGFTEFGKKKPA